MTAEDMIRYSQWLFDGDAGVSSKTIWSVMTGVDPKTSFCYPCDPDDFGRCHRLLVRFPEWRERMGEVAAKYPRWAPMVREWDALTAAYVSISGEAGYRNMYARMRGLRREAGEI